MSTPPNSWSERPLFDKALVYVERASNVEAGSGLEALWSLLALELLARSAIAKVHPALLADPQDGNILFAFGYGEPKGGPRSVPAATVFRRCRVVVPAFTEELEKGAIALMNIRNEELHSGSVTLEAVRSSSWQPEYYAIVQVLLEHLDRSMDDFFTSERAAAAQTLLDGLAAKLETAVKTRIADQKRWFEALDGSQEETLRQRPPIPGSLVFLPRSLEVLCPACASSAWIAGEVAGVAQPRVGDGDVEKDVHILPTRFYCSVCGLKLDGHGELYHAGLGDEYTVTEREDPLEYYDIDPRDYVELEDLIPEEYGNE